MSHLKTPFVLIPIFLNLILLVGIRYFQSFNTNSPMLGLFPLLILALVFPWVVYFVVGGFMNYLGKQSARKREQVQDGDFV